MCCNRAEHQGRSSPVSLWAGHVTMAKGDEAAAMVALWADLWDWWDELTTNGKFLLASLGF